MDVHILTLPNPLEVNLSLEKYQSDHIKPSWHCPSWAEETLKAYLAFTVQTRKHYGSCYLVSSVFTRLAAFADQKGHHSFAGISANLVKDLIKTFSSGSHDNQLLFKGRLRQLILWLAAVDLLPATVFREVYLTGKLEQWFNETEARFGVKTAVNDLLDLGERSLSRLEVPAWTVEAIEQYAEFCNQRVVKTFYSAHQCVVNSAAYIRCLVRHYVLRSFHDLKPSHLTELGLSLRPLGYYYSCFSHFIQFLARHGFIPEYMPEAFLGVAQDQCLFPARTDWSDYPPGAFGPEELYQYRNQIHQLMIDLGYAENTINNAMSGLIRHCLFLQEHGLTFSLKGAVQWCDALPLSCLKKGTYKTILYLGHKLLCHEPVTPDIMLEERYCQLLCKPKIIPVWSEDWCQRYLKQRRQDGLGESTLKHDLISMRFFVIYLDRRKVNAFNSLTPELLHDFDRDCNPGGARYKAEINRKIRLFLLFLAENGVVKYNLVLALPTCSVGKVRPVKILNEEQLQEVYRFCSEVSGECQTRDALAFKLALNLGLRAVDIVNLRFDAIDVKKNVLRFRQRKTGRIVELPLPQTVLNALFEYLSTRRKEHPNEQVMLRSRAPHCRLKSADSVRQRANGLNCDHFTLHQLRKTFASLLLRSGVNFQLIADALGHANAETVHIYLSTDLEMLRSCCFPFTGFELNADGVL